MLPYFKVSALAATCPMMDLSRVVLPTPLRPMMQVQAFSGAVKLMLCRMWLWP
jgi:hypothetical protein